MPAEPQRRKGFVVPSLLLLGALIAGQQIITRTQRTPTAPPVPPTNVTAPSPANVPRELPNPLVYEVTVTGFVARPGIYNIPAGSPAAIALLAAEIQPGAAISADLAASVINANTAIEIVPENLPPLLLSRSNPSELPAPLRPFAGRSVVSRAEINRLDPVSAVLLIARYRFEISP